MISSDSAFKDYSVLSVAQGQIRLNPGTKRNIKGFLQWVKDHYRLNEDPNQISFNLNDISELIRRAKTHKAFIDNSKTVTDTATPVQFTDKIKWIDWYPTFINFLRTIPGRNGVPLNYVCRAENTPIQAQYTDFLNEYVDKAPLNGVAFTTDTAEVHTYLVKFISDNDVAESKLQAHAQDSNGRLDFLSLRDHYEGVGVNALDVTKADRILESLFYAGERRPHMWWGEFERQLTEAFTIYDRREGRQVHSEHMKLRILCRKVRADFLQTTSSAIQLELAKVPITISYHEALTSFRNQVNLKFPPEMSAIGNRSRIRRINEIQSRSGRGGGRGQFGGRGRGGHFNRGGGRYNTLLKKISN